MRSIARPLPLLLLAAPALAQGLLFDVKGQPGDFLGYDLFRFGDLDGDGLAEFGVSAAPQQVALETRVFRGSDGTLLETIEGLPLGDVDGDGLADRHTYPFTGSIDVLSGASGPFLWTIQGQTPGLPLVFDLGDVNGDGADDVFVSGYVDAASGGLGSMEFTVRSGPDGAVLHAWQVPLGQLSIPWPQARPLGDVDGDGVSELIEVADTTARVLTASGLELSNWSVPPIFGELVTGGAGGADVDGDGVPDFALSESDGYAHEDRFTYLFSGATGQLHLTVAGVGAALGDDVDGDGRADLAVADMPDVRLVSGASGAVLRSVRPALWSLGWFSARLGLLPDLDGDGQGELIVSEISYPSYSSFSSPLGRAGRAQVYGGAYSAEIGSALAAAGCPCGNAGSSGTGCANSAGAGARLLALGSTSVSEGHLILGATDTPAFEEAVLFTGPAPLGSPRPFGGGLLLLATPYRRVATHLNDPSGLWTWNRYHGFPQIPDIGAPYEFHQTFQAGQTYRFQVWYTDAADPCGRGFNLTNAVELTMTP